jgi:hypothetical protein
MTTLFMGRRRQAMHAVRELEKQTTLQFQCIHGLIRLVERCFGSLLTSEGFSAATPDESHLSSSSAISAVVFVSALPAPPPLLLLLYLIDHHDLLSPYLP